MEVDRQAARSYAGKRQVDIQSNTYTDKRTDGLAIKKKTGMQTDRQADRYRATDT